MSFPILEIPSEYNKYTQPTENIDINSQIKQKANEIAQGETDLYLVTYEIAEWVRENIKYDLNTLTSEAVQKSSWVMQNKEGVCDEITNLFISMVRSVGIPARFVAGTVYSNNGYKFESHGWAEVYFPSYGWVPFDVTFGQYGWVSPSHVKLMTTEDSGSPSVRYEWKSRGIEIKTEKNQVETEIINKSGTISPETILSIRPLKNQVAPGSYVPLQAKVKNPYQYYLPLTLRLLSAPGLEDDIIKPLMLKPSEEKSVFWLLKIPKNAKEGYIYTSEINAITTFGQKDKAKIQYATKFEDYSKEWAEGRIKELEDRQEKEFLVNLDHKCTPEQETYYSNEEVTLNCVIVNSGNQNINNLNFCIEDQCKTTELDIAERKEIKFTLQAQDQVIITAETEEKIKTDILDLNIITFPKILFRLTPKEIAYREKKELSLLITPNTNLYDTKIKIKRKEHQLGDITNEDHVLKLEAKGVALINGLEFSFEFKDELGKEYEIQEKLNITVTEIPFYRRWFSNS